MIVDENSAMTSPCHYVKWVWVGGWWWKCMFLVYVNSVSCFVLNPLRYLVVLPWDPEHSINVYLITFCVRFCAESEHRSKQSKVPVLREVTFLKGKVIRYIQYLVRQ